MAGFNEHGLFLATDSLATRFDAAGRAEVFNVQKLLSLGPHCAILSGGAGVSVPLSQGLRHVLERHRGPLALEEIARLPNLEVRGLMTVAPLVKDPQEVRPIFSRLRGLAQALGLKELSVGMSDDFEVAIEEGATQVRLGRAIFGLRAG